MTFDEYSKETAASETLISGDELSYHLLGLSGEVGEACNKYKKVLRDSDGSINRVEEKAILDELGDCLFYLDRCASKLGGSLYSIAMANIAKGKDRQARGVIGGSGDSR